MEVRMRGWIYGLLIGAVINGASAPAVATEDPGVSSPATWHRNELLPQADNNDGLFDQGQVNMYYAYSNPGYDGPSTALIIDLRYDPELFSLTEVPPEAVTVSLDVSCTVDGDRVPTFESSPPATLPPDESVLWDAQVWREDVEPIGCDLHPDYNMFAVTVEARLLSLTFDGDAVPVEETPYVGVEPASLYLPSHLHPGTGPDPWEGCSAPFADVDCDHIFLTDVSWLAETGVTRGCDPPGNTRFCPDDEVTRGQMAAFLYRALGLVPGQAEAFRDVSPEHVFFDEINALGHSGISRGCNPPDNTNFCPDNYVTRGQMAAFLVRAFGYTDDGGGDLFNDDNGHVFEQDLDRLATAGVTRGCNPPQNDKFCPDDYVTRGQMAAFLHRAIENG